MHSCACACVRVCARALACLRVCLRGSAGLRDNVCVCAFVCMRYLPMLVGAAVVLFGVFWVNSADHLVLSPLRSCALIVVVAVVFVLALPRPVGLLVPACTCSQIKYCPGNTTIVTIYKYGKNVAPAKKTSSSSPSPDDLLYHLEAQLENVCYETNYTDPHYQSEGFVLGRCDDSYNTLEGEDDVTICDGHSEMNVRHLHRRRSLALWGGSSRAAATVLLVHCRSSLPPPSRTCLHSPPTNPPIRPSVRSSIHPPE